MLIAPQVSPSGCFFFWQLRYYLRESVGDTHYSLSTPFTWGNCRFSDGMCTVALSSLSDARGDIVKLFSFLRSKPHDERERIMRTQIFMSQWKAAAQQILNRMVEIEKNIS